MANLVKLGCGYHGTVSLDTESMLVCKQFVTTPAATACDQALSEYAYLQQFSAVLDSLPHLRCPRPVLLKRDEGIVWMTYCIGEPLDRYLMEPAGDVTNHLDHVAHLISTALEEYIAAFEEPYYDLATRNMIYNKSTRDLCLVDLVRPSRPNFYGHEEAAREVSLGRFIGLSLYEVVRPSNWRQQQYRERQEYLAVKVLENISAQHSLCLSLVRKLSLTRYAQNTSNGTLPRRFWYSVMRRLQVRKSSKAIFDQFDF